MSDVEHRLKEIGERASGYAHFVGIYGRNDGGDDRAFLLALVRKYREAIKRHGEGETYCEECRNALTYNPNESEAKK